LSSIAVVRMRATSTPTIPNAPVKIVSKKLLAKLENGPTHPTCAAATRALGHVVSVANRGEVLLAYPQQLNRCCSRLCVELGDAFQTSERFFRVLRVSNQIERPRSIVNSAQTTVRYPENFNHPLVIGMTIAGTDTRNVTNIRTEFAIAAVNGHIFSNKSVATF